MDYACKHGCLAAMKAMHAFGTPFTPDTLSLAIECGHLEIVKWIQERRRSDMGDDFLERVEIDAMWAAENGQLEILQYLLGLGGVDPSGMVSYAAQNGHLEVVKYLVSVGAKNTSESSESGYSLILAAEKGHLEVVKFLYSIWGFATRDEGVGVRETWSPTDMAINAAAENGHLEVVKFLYATGEYDEDWDSDYALNWSLENGHREVYDFLTRPNASLRSDAAI